MAGFQLLDVIIGLVFMYLSLSLICSGINEWIAQLLTSRSRHLEGWLSRFLSDPGLLSEFLEQPLIKELTNRPYRQQIAQNQLIRKVIGSGKTPAYIPSRTFVLTLLDIFAPVDSTTGKRSLDDIRGEITAKPQELGSESTDRKTNLPQNQTAMVDDRSKQATASQKREDVRRKLRALIGDAENISTAQKDIETWFDDAMERVSGRYKRRTQVVIFALAIAVSMAMNVDSFRLVSALYRDTTIRAAVVAAAQRTTAQQSGAADTQSPTTNFDQVQRELQQLKLPVGWTDPKQHPDLNDPLGLGVALLGWLITAFAVSQGAPFWFDTLNKLVNLRSTGEPPPTTGQK
jgi:hypothetical protein